MRVAFQGERGAFSEEAVRKFLGDTSSGQDKSLGQHVELCPCPSFEEVFRRLDRGEADRAVLPMENTLAGSVHENFDLLLRYKMAILAETQVRIRLNLVAQPGVPFANLRRVFSHPVALSQCRTFFRENLKIQPVSFYDTAGSVKMLMEQHLTDAAAIAPAAAGTIYGARTLRKSLEDDKENFTRFFLLARTRRGLKAERASKTSIVFTTPNKPGALFRCLAVLALREINLVKIESRPLRGKPWEYLFYLDFLGRPEDTPCKNALRHLEEMTDMLRVLGSYEVLK